MEIKWLLAILILTVFISGCLERKDGIEPEFKAKILPIYLDDVQLFHPENRIFYIQYWNDRYNSRDPMIRTLVECSHVAN